MTVWVKLFIMQQRRSVYLGGSSEGRTRFRPHEMGTGSRDSPLRLAIAPGKKIGLPEIVLRKVAPTRVAGLFGKTNDLLAKSNGLRRRPIEVLPTRHDRLGGNPSADIIDLAGPLVGFLSQIDPLGNPTGPDERHARLHPEINGIRLPRTRYWRLIE
ncbi:hypothetical protein ACVWZZ_005280 [Bradyrhizobium sp. LM6.10]